MHRVLTAAVVLALAAGAFAEKHVTVGDGTIDGMRIEPYTFTWQQCVKQDGRWVSAGTVSETLSLIGEHVLRHRQVSTRPGRPVSTTHTYFDRASFAPLRIETEVVKDGEQLVLSERVLTADGYTGLMNKGGERTHLEGAISSNMLHGMVMGLPLAAMDIPEEPIRFLASMVAFDGTYEVIGTWVGTETLHINNTEVVANLVDVEWHHRETGDVYPPGPHASGGRYWIVPDPPPGLPYVPRYKTDTYVVDAGDCTPG